jgi:hypothetical protein
MAAPNIVNVQSIYGNTAVQLVATSPTAIITNNLGSNSVIKVNNLIFSNINTSSNVSATLDLYRSSVSYPISYQITVPLNSSLVVIGKDTTIYLQEGDVLRTSAGLASSLTAVASYETIS